MQHRKSPGSDIPVVGIDCFFITSTGVKKQDELEYEDNDEGKKALEADRANGVIIKCVVVRCSSSKAIVGHVVPCKGHDEEGYVAGIIVDDIQWFGCI